MNINELNNNKDIICSELLNITSIMYNISLYFDSNCTLYTNGKWDFDSAENAKTISILPYKQLMKI